MITQKDLLSEGFWDAFKTGLKEVGKVVAPEIARPIQSAKEWGRKFKSKVSTAKDPEARMINFLNDRGYHPFSKINKGKDMDGNIIFTTKVSALDYDEDGNPKPAEGNGAEGYAYKYPKAIIQMDKDYNFKILKDPRNQVAKYKSEQPQQPQQPQRQPQQPQRQPQQPQRQPQQPQRP